MNRASAHLATYERSEWEQHGMDIMETTTYQIIDLQTGAKISGIYQYAQRNRARNKAERLNLVYGAHRYSANPIFAA